MKTPFSPSPFDRIFSAVLLLTIASGGTALHLANQPTLTEHQERILNSAIAIWTTGTTATIGLLSQSTPDDDGDNDDNGDDRKSEDGTSTSDGTHV